MPKTLKDAALKVTDPYPAQNTTKNFTAIDLEQVLPDVGAEHFEVLISTAATTCATGQTITFTIQDSADNSSFAAVAQCATLVLTGSSNATAATTRRWRLPSNVRRYVRMSVVTSATTGDITAVSPVFELVF
jgi:hypothetical protein